MNTSKITVNIDTSPLLTPFLPPQVESFPISEAMKQVHTGTTKNLYI